MSSPSAYTGTMWNWCFEMPEQLRQATALCRQRGWPGFDDGFAPRSVLIAGMGGSGAAARLAVAALHKHWRAPVVAWSDAVLPAWFGPDDCGIVVSYSGRTWEAMFLADAMRARGATVRCVTGPGPLSLRASSEDERFLLPEGYAPRAALGWILVPALWALAAAQGLPEPAEVIEAAAAAVDVEVAALRNGRSDPGRDPGLVAESLGRPAPHIYSVDELGAVMARRWVNQLQENAKQPAYAGHFTEIAHNEIMSWRAAAGSGGASFVILDDLRPAEAANAPEASQPHRQRTIESALEELRHTGAPVFMVRAAGTTSLERALTQVWLGDAASLLVADERGVDPLPIEIMDRLKARALDPPEPPVHS